MKCLKQPILYTLSHHPRCFQQCSNPEKSEFLLEVTVGLIWLPVDDVTSLSPLLLLVLLGKNRKHQMISESEEGNLWASWLANPLFASVPIAHLLTFFIHNYGCLWIKKTIIKIHSYFGTSLNSVVSFEWPLVAVRVSLSKKKKKTHPCLHSVLLNFVVILEAPMNMLNAVQNICKYVLLIYKTMLCLYLCFASLQSSSSSSLTFALLFCSPLLSTVNQHKSYKQGEQCALHYLPTFPMNTIITTLLHSTLSGQKHHKV